LFVVILAVAGLALVAFHLARAGARDEVWDKRAFLSAGVIALASALWVGLGKQPSSIWVGVAAAAATLGMFVGIGSLELHPGFEIMFPALWQGWGPWVLLLTLALSAVIWRVVEWKSLPRWVRLGLGVLAALVCVADLLSFWQTRTALIDAYSAEYIVNEMLAPAAGRVPYSDFVPQYQSLLSWFVWPFRSLLSADQLIEVTLLELNLLGVVGVVLGVWLAHRSLGRRSLALTLLLVLPLTFVVPFPTRDLFLGSIAAQLPGLPVRIGLGMILAALVIPLLHGMIAGRVSTPRLLSIGAFGAFYLWISQDFGLAAIVAGTFLMLAMPSVSGSLKARALGTVALAFAASLAVYPLLAAAAGRPLDPSTLAFFLRQFGGGFGAEPVQMPGPVLVIVPLILSIALVSLYFIWVLRDARSDAAIEQARFAALTGAFLGCWSTLGLSYYLNRSFASGQMQVLFLPVAVGLTGVLGVILALDSVVPAFKELTSGSRPAEDGSVRTHLLRTYPLTLVTALLVASILATPNPRYEWSRLAGALPSQSLPTEPIVPVIRDVTAAKAYASSQGMSIGYFGPFSNYVELMTGVQSLSLFNHPDDLRTGRTAVNIACRRMNALDPDVIVMSDAGREIAAQFREGLLCERYRTDAAPGVREGYFARRIAPAGS
jgi:hypothetical protein